MIRYALALCIALFAAPAVAQNSAGPEKCADPKTELERQFNEPCYEVEAKAAMREQAAAGIDLVNGARRLIQSGSEADVQRGFAGVRRYVEQAESAFAGYDKRPGGAICEAAGEQRHGVALPCNPLPLLQRLTVREFERLGLPAQATPAAAYGYMERSFAGATAAERTAMVNAASTMTLDLLQFDLLARVEQLRRFDMRQNAVERSREEYQRERQENGTVVGNLTSAPKRLWDVIVGWFTLGVVMLLFTQFVMRRVYAGNSMAGWARFAWSIMFAMIPLGGVYVLIGGFLESGILPIPPMVRNFGTLLVTLALAVFIQHLFPWSRLAALPFMRFLPGWSGIATLHPAGASTIGSGTHGSATISETAEAIGQGHYQAKGSVLADSHGFALGRGDVTAEAAAELRGMDPRFRFMGHVLTCAPTGSGKGIGAVIPTLLDYPGSAFVLDIKGENYAVTARYRRDQLGHEVFVVDPFGVTGGETHGYNWLDRLNPDDPDVVGESAALADMLVMVEGQASDGSAHFNETAKDLLRGLMIHVAGLDDPARRNMGEVRRLLTASEDVFTELLADMTLNEGGQGIPARAANAIISTPDKERGSIISTARRHTAFLDDPRIVAALSRSDFNLADLKAKAITVYIVMPPARLEANKRFMRAFIGQALAAITASSTKPRYKVVFLLDEFAQLGRMQAVEDAISLVRGYGAAFWLFVQDLSQLKAVYPKWQTFLANSAKQFFGTADFDTAKFVSDSLGKRTVEYRTEGSSTSAGLRNSSTGSSESQQFTGRDLLTPDEVMRMPKDRPIVLINGEAPHILARLNYLTDAEYQGLYDPNPFHS